MPAVKPQITPVSSRNSLNPELDLGSLPTELLEPGVVESLGKRLRFWGLGAKRSGSRAEMVLVLGAKCLGS